MNRNSRFESPEEELEYKLEIVREQARSDIKKQKSIEDKKKKAMYDTKITIIAVGGVLIILWYSIEVFGSLF